MAGVVGTSRPPCECSRTHRGWVGPGTWAVRRAAYTEASEFDWYIPHAHNVYLHTLAELGIVGLLAGLFALVPVIWLLVQALRSEAAYRRRWAWGGIFVLVFLALFQLFDFHMNVPAEMALAAIPIASSTPRATGAWRWSGSRRTRHLVGSVGSHHFLAGLRRGDRGPCQGGVGRASPREPSLRPIRPIGGSLPSSTRRRDLDPDLPPYQITLGLVASAQEDWRVAAEAYAKAAEADDMPTSWLGLAQAQIALGDDPQSATASIERALRLGGNSFGALRLGRTLRSPRHVWPGGCCLCGHHRDLSKPRRRPQLERGRRPGSEVPGHHRCAMAEAPDKAWQIALMTGDPGSAHQLAPDGPSYADLAIKAWQGDPGALAAVYALADARPRRCGDAGIGVSPGHTRRRPGAGRSLPATGHLPGDRGRRAAGHGDPGRPRRLDESSACGSRTGYAGHYLYRRPLSRDLLPPGLPRLVSHRAMARRTRPHHSDLQGG